MTRTCSSSPSGSAAAACSAGAGRRFPGPPGGRGAAGTEGERAGQIAQALIDLARMGEALDVHDVERLVTDEAHGDLGRDIADPVKIILPGSAMSRPRSPRSEEHT